MSSDESAATPLREPRPAAEKRLQPVAVKATHFLNILAFLSAIGGFLFGYDTGVVSGAMLIIRKEMELNNTWHEAIVSGTIGAAWIFALVGGYLSDRLGRKPVILAASVIFFVGSVVMGVANYKETLLVGRIIVGIAIGLSSMVVPLYIAEAAPSKDRGLLVTLNVMFITGGQAAAAVLSGALSRKHDGWRYMLGVAAIPALVQFIGFLFMPESPRWLVSRNRDDEARRVLQRIRGTSDVDDEFDSIHQSVEETEREIKVRRQRGQSDNVIVQIFQSASVRRALLVGCLLQLFQQIGGINTVMYYSATIIQMSGFYDTSMAIWLSALIASINFVCTFIGLHLVERVGRRSLTLISLAGVVLSLAFLGAGFQVVDHFSPEVNKYYYEQADMCTTAATCSECGYIASCGFCFYDDPETGISSASCLMSHVNLTEFASEYGPCSQLTGSDAVHSGPETWNWAYGWCPSSYGWITVIGLVLYLVFFAPGMGPMPWTINSEIYPMWARSTCNSIATSTNWFFNLMISMTFLTFMEILGREGAFYMLCGLAALGFAIFWVILPETKGRSLEEMEVLFARPFTFPRSSCCGSSSDDGHSEASSAATKNVHSNGAQQAVAAPVDVVP